MARLFVNSLAKISLALGLSVLAGIAGAQTISYANSPGGYPGNVSYAGGAAGLQTGTPIDLFGPWQFSGAQYGFTFQTGSTSDGWVFSGGTVSMIVGDGGWGGIRLNEDDFVPDILAGTALFTGTLGITTVRDRLGPADEYGYRYEDCSGNCIGSPYDISATFTTSNLHAAYAAALGLPAGGVYNGSFLLGIGSWGDSYTLGEPIQVNWRQVSLDLDTAGVAPIPEPEIYAMMGLGLGLLGWVGRRRKQQAAA